MTRIIHTVHLVLRVRQYGHKREYGCDGHTESIDSSHEPQGFHALVIWCVGPSCLDRSEELPRCGYETLADTVM